MREIDRQYLASIPNPVRLTYPPSADAYVGNRQPLVFQQTLFSISSMACLA